MATRTKTRYRRTSVAFGGSFWRFDPASQTPGGGGAMQSFASAAPQAAAAPAPPAAQPYTALLGLVNMGGSVLGNSPDGTKTYVNVGGVGGQVFAFDARTGAALGSAPVGTLGADGRIAAIPAAGAPAGGATAGGTPTGGAPAGGGTTATATGSRVGTTVNGTTAAGVSISGTITSVDANGNVIVQWQDGSVSTYSASGQHISTTPPAGAAGTVTGADGTTTTAPTNVPGPVINDPDNPNAPGYTGGQTTTVESAPAAGAPAAGSGTFIEFVPGDTTTGGGPKPTAAAVQPDSSVYGAPNTPLPPTEATAAPQLTAGTESNQYAGPPSPEYFNAYNGQPTTTAPTSPYAPPPVPLYGDAFGNMVPLEQLLAGFDARVTAPPTYQAPAPTPVAESIAPPTSIAFDPGVNVPPSPYEPPPVYGAPGDAYLTQ